MTTEAKHDIQTRADIERLVDLFYGDAMEDPLIGYIFTDVAHLDMEKHRPVITDFWETLLLDAQSYGGGAFGVHYALHRKSPFSPGHFSRWLRLWERSVNELFEGPVAIQAVAHGQRIAAAFQRRLANPEFDPVYDGPVLQITTVNPGA